MTIRETLKSNTSYASVAYAKIDQNLPIAWDKLTDNIVAHLAWHGLQQMLGDTGAGLKKADEIVAAANKKLDALYVGTLRVVRSADPKTKYARQAMFAHVQKAWAKAGKVLNKHYKAAELNAEVERRLADESDLVAVKIWEQAEAHVVAMAELDALEMPEIKSPV